MRGWTVRRGGDAREATEMSRPQPRSREASRGQPRSERKLPGSESVRWQHGNARQRKRSPGPCSHPDPAKQVEPKRRPARILRRNLQPRTPQPQGSGELQTAGPARLSHPPAFPSATATSGSCPATTILFADAPSVSSLRRPDLNPAICAHLQARATFPGHYAHSREEWPRQRDHSHSIVPGGLLVTSYTTRLTPLTSLIMRVAVRPRKFMSN